MQKTPRCKCLFFIWYIIENAHFLCFHLFTAIIYYIYLVKINNQNFVNILQAIKSQDRQAGMQQFFNRCEDNSSIQAEVLFAQFVAEHNVAFSVADHFTKLSAKMFPDSEIAKKFACGKTKTTCIVKGAIASELNTKVTT